MDWLICDLSFHFYIFTTLCVEIQFSSVAPSCPTLCDPHGLQHTRLPCPSPSPRACSNSCPLSRWCHPTISSSVIPFLPALNLSQHQGLFKWVRWPKYWNFSISPSNEYSGLISFRDWLVWSPRCSRNSQESSPTPQFKSINSSALSLLHSPTLTSIHDHRKNHSLD